MHSVLLRNTIPKNLHTKLFHNRARTRAESTTSHSLSLLSLDPPQHLGRRHSTNSVQFCCTQKTRCLLDNHFTD